MDVPQGGRGPQRLQELKCAARPRPTPFPLSLTTHGSLEYACDTNQHNDNAIILWILYISNIFEEVNGKGMSKSTLHWREHPALHSMWRIFKMFLHMTSALKSVGYSIINVWQKSLWFVMCGAFWLSSCCSVKVHSVLRNWDVVSSAILMCFTGSLHSTWDTVLWEVYPPTPFIR